MLHFFVRFGNVKTALEFGTASGYSAIWIAKALAPDGHLITIEWETRLADLARDNMKAFGLQDNVTIMNADASTALQDIHQEFDLIFVDCAHFEALRFSEKHLRKNGLFICDNVGFIGFEGFNKTLLSCSFLETIYLQCYLY